ncbi:unnamed protein product [Acanthoscelides obtectus]|uniref:C2H2-type domain-containing protein n=1 Tax=Acanthoscelides obtectus TaxID=200917 RepID=A0A9P0Q7X5_ACAOB|nr:unnamed protein product [Acanthoscelides obtectus]CAK1676200.1 Zinc finger protein 84 [Acanthoscelides obtectus]
MLRHTTKLIICKHCNTSFKTKQSLFDHILRIHPNFIGTISNKIYECMHCAHKGTRRSNFIRHMAKHNSQTTFKYINCDASFNTKLRLENHILQKHPKFAVSESSKIRECTHCEYKTAYKEHLVRHMLKHTGAKCTCTKCDASFTEERSLDNHILQKHPELSASVSDKIHKCTHCEYKTTKAQYLAEHIRKHTGVRLTCTKCDASFIKKISLHNHILRKHPELSASVSHKIHECTHCEYKTAHSHHLASHMMKHTGTKVTCTKCYASFIMKISLHDHILRKHPELSASVSHKIYECTHCEYKTTKAQYLAEHILKHTGVKLTCTKCDASFIRKLSLDNHILQKHPEFTSSVSRKIHKCTHCEYKSLHKPQFIIHTMKHTGAKHNCTKCDATFTTKRSLHNHIVQKHPQLTASVSSKIHKCTHCEYKTTLKKNLTKHMMKCDASFPRKEYIDNHTSEKHPQLTASVNKLKKSLDRFNTSSCDIYECCNVTFDCKSTFDDHVIKNHADIVR